MNDAPDDRQPPRRSFLEAPPPTPFLKSPEGRRLLFFALLLSVAGALMYWQYRRAEARIEEAAARRALEQAAAKDAIPLETQLQQRRVDLETAFEGAFRDTSNGDDFIETGGYHKLIELLGSASPEEVTRRAADYLDRALAMREPDLLRGRYFRVRGVCGGLFAVKLENAVHDITDVWRGSISQPDAETDVVVFDLIGDPPRGQLDLQRSVVEIDGLMYRKVSYESKTGAHKSAPYLLARNLRVLEDKPPSGGAKILAIVVGLSAIIGYLVLRSSLRSKKRPPVKPTRIKDLFEAKRRADRAQERH